MDAISLRSLGIMGIMLLCFFASEARPRLRRICTSVSNVNSVSWYPFGDTCQDVVRLCIYARVDDFSSFKKVDSIKNPGFEYEHLNAQAYVRGSYFIEFVISCAGKEVRVKSDTLKVDLTPPGVVEPDSVSVLPDGKVVIGWESEPSPDVKGYKVYNVRSNLNHPVADVIGKYNTTFIDSVSGSGSGKSLVFRLAGVDSCDNVGALSGAHQTVFIQANLDSCKREVTLNWSAYQGWPAGVKEYIIYGSLPGKPYVEMGRTPGLQYIISDAQNNAAYTFFVRAIRKNKEQVTSSSNRLPFLTNFQDSFSFVYVKSVSVKNNAIELKWVVSDSAGAGRFEISKSKGPGLTRVISHVTANGRSEYTYTDTDVDPSRDTWYYKILAYNTCGGFGGKSNVSNNIVLSLEKIGFGRKLTWTNYSSWGGRVASYSIRRRWLDVDGTPVFQEIGTTGPNDFTFLDADTVLGVGTEGVCYTVIAIEGDGNSLGFKETSSSNTVCYIEPPLVYIPTAFQPDGGVNATWKASLMNVNNDLSNISIYNRWGERIFDSKPDQAWDGKMKGGDIAPDGPYMYYFKIIGYDGSVQTFKGVLYLL